MWNKEQPSEARAAKRAAEETRLQEVHGGSAGLADHRASVAAAAASVAAGKRIAQLREAIRALRPGALPPAELPTYCASKAAAKTAYHLTEKELKELPLNTQNYAPNYSCGTLLLAAARRKHGGPGFEQWRQSVADAQAKVRRAGPMEELANLEAQYPAFKIYARKAAEDDAAKLEAKASEAEAKAKAAEAAAKSLRAKAKTAREKAVRIGAAEAGPTSSADPASSGTAAEKRKGTVVEVGVAAAASSGSPAAPVKLAPLSLYERLCRLFVKVTLKDSVGLNPHPETLRDYRSKPTIMPLVNHIRT